MRLNIVRNMIKMLIEYLESPVIWSEELRDVLAEVVEWLPNEVLAYDYDDDMQLTVWSNKAGKTIKFYCNQLDDGIKALKDLCKELSTLYDPDCADLEAFMMKYHKDRLCRVKGTYRLTVNSGIEIGQKGYDHNRRQDLLPTEVLVKYLGYPSDLVEKALLGNETAVEEYNDSIFSCTLPTSVFDTQAEIYVRRVPEIAEDELKWVQSKTWEALGVIESEKHSQRLFFPNYDNKYLEIIHLQHLNYQRSRHALNEKSYWVVFPDRSKPATEMYIVSSVLDAVRLIVFFDSIGELAGKMFASIGDNNRVAALEKVIEDSYRKRSDMDVYICLRNKNSRKAIKQVEKLYPAVKDHNFTNDTLSALDYNPHDLLQVMPDKYREIYKTFDKLKICGSDV